MVGNESALLTSGQRREIICVYETEGMAESQGEDS